MTGLLEDRVAVVTGGARGIGLAIVRRFLAEGARVVLGDLDEEALAAATTALAAGDRVRTQRVDVSSGADVEAVVAAAADGFGRLDVMVNNAGMTRDATMRRMTEDDFDRVVAVHLRGCWLGTRSAAQRMRELGVGGSIVNMSSISGKVGMAGQTNYSAAKAGIVGLTKAAAKEVGFAGVRVNAIQPGIVRTGMTDALRDDILAAKVSEVPLGRIAEPEEIAAVATFLASDMASYVTGSVIEVTGGRHI